MAENSQGGVGQDAIDLLRNARTQIIDELSRDNFAWHIRSTFPSQTNDVDVGNVYFIVVVRMGD